MSRLSIETPGRAQNVLDGLHRDMERRIGASAYGLSGGYVFELPAAVPCADLWEMCALPHWSGTVGGADRAGA